MLADVQDLGKDPKFLALSDDAKRIIIGKRDPGFAKLSPEAQGMIVQKHFPTARLQTMPAQDPTAALGLNIATVKKVGKGAARVAAPIVGGALGAASPIPGGTYLGAGIASAFTSYMLGDPEREVIAQGITGAILPGPGETLLGGVLKGATAGGVSSTIDSVAKEGKLPEKGQLAFSLAVGGLTGGVGTKISRHLEELFPKDVAASTGKILEGDAGKVASGAEAQEINTLKATAPFRDSRGRFTKRPFDMEGLRTGGVETPTPATPSPLGPKVVRGPGGRFMRAPAHVVDELKKEDLFPAYEPPIPSGTPGKVKGLTAVTSSIQRPGWLADHVQSQTGVPVYDDVYRPLRAAIGNREKLDAEIERINSHYLKDRSLDPKVKDIIGSFSRAAAGYHDGEYHALVYGIRELRRRVPFFGKEIDEATARRWANHLISSPYVSMLPFRVAPAVRVFAHTFQTGFMKVGGKYLGKGLARAFTREGMQEAVKAGAVGAEAFNVPEEVLAVESKGWYGKLIDWGFAGFRFSQNSSRAAIFHAAKIRAADALKSTRNFEDFVDKAGLDVGIPRAEIARFKFLYDNKRFEEAKDLAGVVHAWGYIPGHSNLDRPFVNSETTLGRFATQYINWPSFYAQTLKENFLGPGPAGKKAVMASRWLLGNATLLGIAASAYSGKNGFKRAAEFTGLGPIFYTGGPGLQELAQGVGGLKDVYTGTVTSLVSDKEKGKKEIEKGFRQSAQAVPIPFKGVYQDVKSLFDMYQ